MNLHFETLTASDWALETQGDLLWLYFTQTVTHAGPAYQWLHRSASRKQRSSS